MRKGRMKVYTALIAVVLAVLIAFSGVMCLQEAFGLVCRPEWLLAVCAGAAVLAAAAMCLHRSWLVMLPAALVLAGLLARQHRAAAESLSHVLWRVTGAYAMAFPGVPVVGQDGGNAEPVLAVLAVLLSWLTVWLVCREGSAVLEILAVLPIYLLCLMVVDLAPELWLVLLTGGVMVLVISHHVRERSAAEGARLSWWLMLPTVILLSVITALWPPADYVRAEWSDNLQKMAETRVQVRQWVSAVQDSRPRWNRELKTVDLSLVGPKTLTGTPVMDYRADAQIAYLRGVSLGAYADNRWQALESDLFLELPEGEQLQTVSYDGEGLLQVKTLQTHPQIYTAYYLSELPAAALAVDDAYIRNEDRTAEYAVSFGTAPNRPVDVSYELAVQTAYTQLPQELRPTLRDILEENGLAGASAQQIASFVQSLGRYELDTPAVPAGEDFVLYFLQESRQGYCIHFASAAVLLLRAEGIPARYVTGYAVSGDPGQWHTVTEDEAHAWVEYYVNGLGWLPLDPTPAAQDRPQELQPQTSPGDTPQTQTQAPPEAPEIPPSEQEPEPQSSPEGAVPSGGRTMGLWWLAAAAALPGVLILRRALALRCRRKRLGRKPPNQRALALWRWLLQLERQPEEALYALAGKARFSQHTLTPEELQQLSDALQAAVERAKQQSLGKRLWQQYGRNLY